MNPGRFNISLYQGDTWTIAPKWKIDGFPVNVTGFTAKMQARIASTSTSVIVELSTANGRIVTGGMDGTFTLTLLPAETSALTPGEYVYDFEVTAPNGTVTKLLQGGFSVLAEVTR